MASPADLKFTKDHEWVRVNDGEAVVGISDYAQGELGDITYIELPDIGLELQQSGTMGAIESVKAASDIYAPVAGKVIAINPDLEDAPEKINESPYEEGWLARLELADLTELDTLMSAEEYDAYVEETRS